MRVTAKARTSRWLVCLVLLLALFNANSLSAKALTPGGTISWLGGSWYLLGANYPWKYYGNDFGSNGFGAYGVHLPATYNAVNADFTAMAAEGIHTARWWVFGDGRAGITFDGSGMPTGIDAYVFPDLDAAVQIAGMHGIYLNLVLLDFAFIEPARSLGSGVVGGGHWNVINTTTGQQDLLNNVFVPIFRRYGNNPQIISWEVMNEPEWCITQDAVASGCTTTQVSLTTFQSFTQSTATSVHTYTHSYVTVGEAGMRYATQWEGQGLDFYEIHYYDWMHPYAYPLWDLYDTTYATLKLDAPVVVGEFPAGTTSSTATLQQYLDRWFTNGYAGAWPWSFAGVDANGAPNATTLLTWATAHSSLVNIVGIAASRSVSQAAAASPPGRAPVNQSNAPPSVGVRIPAAHGQVPVISSATPVQKVRVVAPADILSGTAPLSLAVLLVWLHALELMTGAFLHRYL